MIVSETRAGDLRGDLVSSVESPQRVETCGWKSGTWLFSLMTFCGRSSLFASDQPSLRYPDRTRSHSKSRDGQLTFVVLRVLVINNVR